MDQLRSAKGVFELQKNGHTLIQKVRELKEENRRRIQEQIDMLRKESTASNKKVYMVLFITDLYIRILAFLM